MLNLCNTRYCLTTDPDVLTEACDVPRCGDEVDDGAGDSGDICLDCTVQECGTESVEQADYRGAIILNL